MAYRRRGGGLIYRRSNERMYWEPGHRKEAVRPSVTFVHAIRRDRQFVHRVTHGRFFVTMADQMCGTGLQVRSAFEDRNIRWLKLKKGASDCRRPNRHHKST